MFQEEMKKDSKVEMRRDGTHFDCESLDKVGQKLGFDVKQYHDLTKAKLRKTLSKGNFGVCVMFPF